MMSGLSDLLAAASGPSKELDRAVADAFGVPARDYSASVEACLELIHAVAPAAHWHVGRAADGVSVYARLSEGEREVEKTAMTVPLALLGVVAGVKSGLDRHF